MNEKQDTRPLPPFTPDVHAWATEALAAMLARVKSVCITEYGWMIDELRK